jgi:hypothetical protein
MLTSGSNATLNLRSQGAPTSASGIQITSIAALAFSVVNDRAQAAAQPTVNGIDPSKPITFVTKSNTATPAQPGVSSVQAAVVAGLKSSREVSPATPTAPTAVAKPAVPAFAPEVASKPGSITPVQAAVLKGLKASREKADSVPSNVVARADELKP